MISEIIYIDIKDTVYYTDIKALNFIHLPKYVMSYLFRKCSNRSSYKYSSNNYIEKVIIILKIGTFSDISLKRKINVII
jgi:hypothetical protein